MSRWRPWGVTASLTDEQKEAVLKLYTEEHMAVRGIAKMLSLDRDSVRNFVNSVKEGAGRSKEPGEVALGVVAQRAREEVQVEAVKNTDEVFLLGREVQREYKALAAGWGLTVGEYLKKMVEFGEENVERVDKLEKVVATQGKMLETAARALDPVPIRRQAVQSMINAGHKFTREEIDLLVWGEVRGCIRCRGPDRVRDGEASGATQDARGGGPGAGAGARPGGAGDGEAEERGRAAAHEEAEASAGGAVDG